MAEGPPKQRFVTDSEAAAVLGLSVKAVVDLRQSGRIAYVPGRPPVIERCDLEAFQRWQKMLKPWVQIEAEAVEWARHAHFMRRLRSGYFDNYHPRPSPPTPPAPVVRNFKRKEWW